MAAQPGEPAQGQRTESDGLAVTGGPSDSPWSRPADKRCVFIKNRPATSSHRKQGLPVSVPALSPRFAVLPLVSSITDQTRPGP